jgi:hypothetical protein
MLDVALLSALLMALGISALLSPIMGGALALGSSALFYARLIQLNAQRTDLGPSLWTRRTIGFYSGLIVGTLIAISVIALISFERTAALALWAMSLPFFYYGAEFLQTRYARGGMKNAHQTEDPILYWLLMATPILGALFLATAGVYYFGCNLR